MTFLVAALLASSSAEQGNIIQDPVPINASLGAVVQYSCTVNGSILYWTIDGSTAYPKNIDRMISTVDISESGSPEIISSNLTFTANSNMNGSSIACNSVFNNAAIIAEVTLLIQGPLQAVGNLTATVVDSTDPTDEGVRTYRLTWEAPFTVIGVPILEYKVTSQGLHSHSMTTTSFATNSVLQHVDWCDDYNFSVTAVNGAGDGDVASTLVHHLEVPSLLRADTVLTQPNSAELVQADFTVMVNHSCVGKIEEYAKAIVNGQMHTFGPFLPAGDKISFIVDELTRSQHYNVLVWIENIDGKSNAIEMALSTFAVQDINYSVDSQGTLCIECLFLSGLSSGGCLVMVSAVDGKGSKMVRIYRTDDEQSAIGCINNLASGVYNFTVYDVINNGQEQNIVAFEEDKVTIVTSSDPVTSTIAMTTEEPATNLATEGATQGNPTSPNFPILGSAVAVGLLLVTLAVTLLIIGTSCLILKRRRTKQWTFRNSTQERSDSFSQRQNNEYEFRHILHPNSPDQQTNTRPYTDVDMTIEEIPPIPPGQSDRRSLILESEKEVSLDTLRRSNSQPIFSAGKGGGGGGEQSSDHTSFRVTTPLRDAAVSIIADPMALNTSVTESPPSYMNLALHTPHRVRGTSNASEDTRRLTADSDARAYEDTSQEPKIDYGRQMHLQYYFQSMMENSQQDFNQSPTQEFARHRTPEYVQLDVNSLQRRESGDEFGVADPNCQANSSRDRVQYAAVVHSPFKHDHFFSQTSNGSLV